MNRGTLKGERACGYGVRYLVAASIPQFRNNGFNHWSPLGADMIEVKGLSVDHPSFDGGNYHRNNGLFMGWVFLDNGKRQAPVFLSPVEADTYRISG